MVKYYGNSKQAKKIAFSRGSKGLVFVINPDGRKMPIFTFNKSGTINDKGLADHIMNEFNVVPNNKEGSYVRLLAKPLGEYDGMTLHKLTVDK
jgi:hypothetical protein